ncbi:hypothetical protein BKA69DRAFT_761189 [Paraphysoderma sedebokerense]|nr:hypothetical protein BKA69DRAFT_761189 [Paraphysoderma sedebokerense]
MQRPTSFSPAQLADVCQQSVHSNIIVCFKETEDATEGSDNVHAVEERVAPDSSHQFLTMKALTSLLVISKLYKCLTAEGHRNKKAIFVFLSSSAEEITHYATYFEKNDLHQIHCVRATNNEYSTEKDWKNALYNNSNAPVVLFATFRLFLNAMVCGYINSKAVTYDYSS